MTKDELIAFEADIAREYDAAKIRAPIHLDGGCEDDLIEIFRNIKPDDWCLGQWRSHYICLLHGVPPDKLKAEIMAGRSISLCFPEHRVLCSAIAGGHLPIALGIAWAIKRRGGSERVLAFMGDMVAEMGIAEECIKYSAPGAFDLPVTWVVQDNGKSVCTDTRSVWGNPIARDDFSPRSWSVIYTRYELPWPHSGAGKRINF